MPEIVLRNPNLPGQPIVVTVGLDGIVPAEYKAGGWEIDHDTDPRDALAETPRPTKREAPKARFADDELEVVKDGPAAAAAEQESPAEPDDTDEPSGLPTEGE